MALGICPQLSLGYGLLLFPDPIPLDIEASAAVVRIQGNLLEPQHPALAPVVPGCLLCQSRWRYPHGCAEDLFRGRVFGNIKESVTDAPSTSDTQGDSVTRQVHL